jgi:transcriptional regulator of arginine metabolism
MERSIRLARLRQIIQTRSIDSQERLLAILAQEGFAVTQATLSRDLKALKIGKLPDGRGGYLYAPADGAFKAGSEKSLIGDFLRGFLSIEFSGNQAVIKTLPGHANSVAFALDNLAVREVLGTIAGDDTILIVPRDGVSRKALLSALQARIPGLRETRS